LVDQALLVFVNKFDRVLDRDDVVLTALVDRIDHCAERVDLPEPVGPVTTNESLGQRAKVHDRLRKPKLLRRQDL